MYICHFFFYLTWRIQPFKMLMRLWICFKVWFSVLTDFSLFLPSCRRDLSANKCATFTGLIDDDHKKDSLCLLFVRTTAPDLFSQTILFTLRQLCDACLQFSQSFCRRFLYVSFFALTGHYIFCRSVSARCISRIALSEQHVCVRNFYRKWLLRHEKRISVSTAFKLYFSPLNAGVGRTHDRLPC